MTPKAFPLPSLGKFPRIFPILIGAVLPLLIIIGIALASGRNQEWQHALPALLTLPVAALLIAASMNMRKVELLDGSIRVRRWPIPRSFPLDGLDIGQARVVDIGRESSLHPVVKLVGSRMPGFRSGWFRLRDGRRSFVLSTSGSRALYLPRRDGSVLLLAVERPEELLRSLNELSARHG